MDTSQVTIRIAQPSETARIAGIYAAWNYSGGISPSDTAWLAEIAGEWIGIVKVAPENGTLVLRGMRVAAPWQRRGIGSKLLTALASWLKTKPCYCLPYTHLTSFYAQIGFAEIPPTQAPEFLSSRLAKYKSQGLDLTIMSRYK